VICHPQHPYKKGHEHLGTKATLRKTLGAANPEKTDTPLSLYRKGKRLVSGGTSGRRKRTALEGE